MISQGTLAATAGGNYTITAFNNGAESITPASLTVTADNQTKVYGTNDPTFTQTASTGLVNATVDGLAIHDTASSVSYTGALTRATAGTLAGEQVGTGYVISRGTLAATAGGNYTITAFNNGAESITPASLTVTADNQTKVYGTNDPTFTQTASTGLVNATVDGLAIHDTASSVSYTGALTRATAGTLAGEQVGTGYVISWGTLAATAGGNYVITAFNNGAESITPASLTVTADNQTKVYGTNDPTFTQTISAGLVNATVDGLVIHDTASSVSYTGALTRATAGTLAGEQVGTGYVISRGTLAATAGGNYTITAFNNGAESITPASLTVTADNQTKVYGTNDPTFTQTASTGLVNATVDGLAIHDTASSVSYTGALTRATAGTLAGEQVGTGYVISRGTLAATAGGNYVITAFNNGAESITPASLTVTADNQTKVYGTNDPTFTQTISAGLVNATVDGLVIHDTASSVSYTGALTRATAGTLAGEQVGTGYVISRGTLAATAGGNYTITAFNNGAESITPASLTVTADNQTKVYGTNDPTFTQTASTGLVNATVDGLAIHDTASSVSYTGALTRATAGTLAGEQVGTGYVISQGTLAATAGGNYTITAFNNGAESITPASLTVTADAKTKVYGASDPALTYTSSGLVVATVDGLALHDSSSSVLTGSLARNPGETVAGGPYAITQGGVSASANYTITYNGNYLTITPAPLTITPNNESKTYGTLLTFTGSEFTSSGLVNSETIGSVTLTSAGTPTTASVAGSPYTINGSNASGGTFNPSNYSITYNTGTLTVNPLSVTVTGTRTYNGTPNAPGSILTVVGEIPNDPTLTLTGTGTVASPNVNPSAPITSIGTLALSGTGSSNYVLTGGSIAITPAPLSITANNQTKTYGSTLTFAGTEFTSSGLEGNDTVGTVTLVSPGTPATASVAGSPYAITPSAATGGTFIASNYSITYNPGTLTVNPALLTVTPNNASKTYGTALIFTGSEFTSSGLVNSETIGSVTLTSAGTPATASVAGSPYTINGSNASGGTFNPSNYSITYNTGTLTVNPLAVTVTGTRNYDGTPNAPGTILTVIGEIPNDPTLTLTGTGTLQSPNANPSTPTTITSLGNLALTGTGSSNYVLTGGTVTINPAPLSITANNQTKTYGSTLTFAGTEFTPSGLQGNDTVGTVTLVSPGTPATASVAGSPYAITPSAATGGTFIASNYTITYNPGTLTVNPLAVTVTGTRTYDGTPNAPGTILTVVGEIPGDPTLTTTGTGTLQTPNVNSADPITSLGTLVLTGTGSSNYVLNGGTVAITPANLTITANNQTKTYGTALTFAGTEFTSSGLQGGDTVGRVTLVSAGTPATAAVAGSPYAITPSAATGGTFAASNYTIRYVAGTLTINPLAVTVTGTRLFDGGTDASGSILTVLGELPGDPTLTLSGTGNLAGPDANATPTPITAFGTLALVGPGSTNYVLTSGAVLITAPVTQVNVPDQTSAGAGVQTVGVFTNGILLPRPQQNGVVGGQFATGAGCEDNNTQCDVPTNGAAAAEATGTQSGTELISGKNSGKGS